MTRIKICGLARKEDAELAIELGADALGFVFEPRSPRYIGNQPELIDWALGLPPFDPKVVAVYGVCREDPLGFDMAQAHTFDCGTTPERLLVVRPSPDYTPDSLIVMINELSPSGVTVDAFHSVHHGGTGQTIAPNFFVGVRETLAQAGRDLPMVLSGGLNPDNVGPAISQLRPYAVDVSSGIETSPGRKDASKLKDFILAVRAVG